MKRQRHPTLNTHAYPFCYTCKPEGFFIFLFELNNKFRIDPYYKDMGIIVYERPREKLQNRGVESLSLAELLQLIIGSGASKQPGAKLARLVEKLLSEGKGTYDTLMAIPGMGTAKTCQVLAALEMARRFHDSSN